MLLAKKPINAPDMTANQHKAHAASTGSCDVFLSITWELHGDASGGLSYQHLSFIRDVFLNIQ